MVTHSPVWTESGHLLSQPESFIQHQDGGVLSSTAFSSVHPPVADAVDFDSEILMGPINSDPSRRVFLKDTRVLVKSLNRMLIP